MLWGLLLSFLPDEMNVLLVMGAGFAIVLGLISPGQAFMWILGLLVLSPIVGMIVTGIIGQLPPAIVLFILAIAGFFVVSAVTNALLGRRAANAMAATMARLTVRLLAQIIILPFRVAVLVIRGMARQRV